MRRILLRVAAALAVLPLVLLLAGCGGSTAADVVEVQFWHAMGGPLGKVLDGMIQDFNASHPKIHVHGINMGNYDTLQKKILASVVARRNPDISQNYEALTLKLARAGKLVCIDDLIEADLRQGGEDIRDDLIPVMRTNNTFDGKLWSFPFNKSVPALYYNREMFSAAGLDPDKPPRTVEELTDAARRLTKDFDEDGRPDQIGYAFTLRNAWIWECRFLQAGGRLFDPVARRVFFDEPAATEALRWYVDLIKEGIAYGAEGFDHQADFLAHKLGMFESSVVSKVFMDEQIQESGILIDYGLAAIPHAGKEEVVLSGTNINIFASPDEAKVQAAWTFVKWFTSTENGVRWSLGTTYMPVRSSSLRAPEMLEAYAEIPGLESVYAQLDHAIFDPRIPEWFECRAKLADAIENAVVHEGREADFLKEAHDNINFILEFSLDRE